MMTLDQVIFSLSDRNLTVVAERTGLNYHTVCRLVNGEVKPSYTTLKKLSDYLTGATE